jgi:putative OPT family oligopeptide transporter
MSQAPEEKRGLPPEAYDLPEGQEYPPYVPADDGRSESTWRAVLTGTALGIVFGAANAYLGLVAGLTISTSIPIAVLAVLVFTALPPFGRMGSILETNLAQTIGSASSSLASGMIFTIPALYYWHADGKLDAKPELLQIVVISAAGGLLGVLFMIPLRRFLIRGEHGKLPYPEGTACAEVLVAAERGGTESRPIFYGLAMGAVVKLVTKLLTLVAGSFGIRIGFIPKAEINFSVSPALLGVGYILGVRIAAVMVGGGLLASLVIIPAIAIWGDGRSEPFYPETTKLIRDMTAFGGGSIWDRYVRYIGAGAVAFAGIWSLIRSLPTIIESFRVGFAELARKNQDAVARPRTDRDLSLKIVLLIVIAVVLSLALLPPVLGFIPGFMARLISALLIAVFAFFFVTVSSRIVGLVGVTSNPTSGMTIATLLLVSGLFLVMGYTGAQGMAQALCIGAVVATAASIAGDTSQDLKSGFLIGATPWKQQVGELFGVLTSVTFVALAVMALFEAYPVGSDEELPAPQANLMRLVIEGVISSDLPWGLVFIGAGIAALALVARIPVLPFAVGIYLPVSTMTPIFLGGLLRWWMERSARDEAEKTGRRERGVLFGSGLVGGEGLIGVVIAIAAVMTSRLGGQKWPGFGTDWAGGLVEWVAAATLGFLAVLLWRIARGPASKTVGG